MLRLLLAALLLPQLPVPLRDHLPAPRDDAVDVLRVLRGVRAPSRGPGPQSRPGRADDAHRLRVRGGPVGRAVVAFAGAAPALASLLDPRVGGPHLLVRASPGDAPDRLSRVPGQPAPERGGA